MTKRRRLRALERKYAAPGPSYEELLEAKRRLTERAREEAHRVSVPPDSPRQTFTDKINRISDRLVDGAKREE